MSETLITRSLVETALARRGTKLDDRFTDEYFAGLTLRGGKGDGCDGDRCSIQERRAWEELNAKLDDIPEGDCPVIGKFMIRFQDGISDTALRTRLCLPLLIASIGSKSSKAVEERRRWIAADWAIREVAAVWAEQSEGLKEWADKLRALPPIQNSSDVENARVMLDAFRSAAWALRNNAVANLRDKIKAELEKRGFSISAADAAAVADAAAAAVAAAVAAADAVADAAAVADGKKIELYSPAWYRIREAAYKAIREKLGADGFGERYHKAALATWESGAKCVERMLAVTEATL